MFLSTGVVITGHAILTPTLMVLMMVTGDFLAMSSSTDNVRPSPKPNRWRIHNLTIAGIIMGVVDLMFCVACLATGRFLLGLDTETLRTLTVITLVFSGQMRQDRYKRCDIERETAFSRVAGIVGLGLGRSKIPYLSMGID